DDVVGVEDEALAGQSIEHLLRDQPVAKSLAHANGEFPTGSARCAFQLHCAWPMRSYSAPTRPGRANGNLGEREADVGQCGIDGAACLTPLFPCAVAIVTRGFE